MNDVFLKRLTAPTITSGGNPPAFSLTPDGRLTAKNADISGNVNANSGALNNVTINENCRVLGKLSANQIEGDLVKTVGKAFPRDSRAPERWPDRRQQRRVAPRRHPRRRQRQLAVRRQQLRAKVRRNPRQRALRQRQNGQRILHPPWRLRMRARRKRG
ncbi:hypothetical protein AB0V23_14235 [Escherichia coli]